jgi:hypothetical protein
VNRIDQVLQHYDCSNETASCSDQAFALVAPRSVGLSYLRAAAPPRRLSHRGIQAFRTVFAVSVTKVRIVKYRINDNKNFFWVICARNWGPKPAGSEASVDSFTADVKNVWS